MKIEQINMNRLISNIISMFEYRIKVQRADLETGNFSIPFQISTPSPTIVRSFVSWNDSDKVYSTQVADSITIIVNIFNQTRVNDSITWYISHPDSLLVTKKLNGHECFDTLALGWSNSGTYTLHTKIQDQAGELRTASETGDARRCGAVGKPGALVKQLSVNSH